MIRPVNFAFNQQTAITNAFQVPDYSTDIQHVAEKEFDGLVDLLRSRGVDVLVVNDTPIPHTPDSVFPNNWISFHEDGTMVLYPMHAENRRLERKQGVMEAVKKKFNVSHTIDFSVYEKEEKYLEGTGSMVLDRESRIAYACISPRTNKELLKEFCVALGYRGVIFKAVDSNGTPIYHTNVMMCVADRYVVVCLEAINDTAERDMVEESIKASGKQVVQISLEQMKRFAGNMLQVQNASGEKLLVMSTSAFESLSPGQRSTLTTFNEMLHARLDVIEKNGGGSARCMMAEIFLPVL